MSGSIFVSVSDMPWSWNGWIQLLFIGFIYTYLVINGCMLIGEGSELLELTKYGPLVGPTILPVLGAVPDGAIVLFSGIGSDAQSQLETGVGALAGSTVMLLTVPWILCVIGGRVNLDENGVGTYKSKPKLNPPDNMDIFTTGGIGIRFSMFLNFLRSNANDEQKEMSFLLSDLRRPAFLLPELLLL